MSTRPAAGADPFLTIKILKCQAFSENPVCRTTGFYQILKIKNSGEKKKMNIRIRLHVSQLKDTSIHTISFGYNHLEREAGKDHPNFLQMKSMQTCQNSSHRTKLLKIERKTRSVLETLPWHFSGLGKTLDLFGGKFIRGSPTVSPKIVPAGISAGDVIPLTKNK